MTADLRIDIDRLRAEMTELGAIGRVEGVPGINRPGFSDADMAARDFMAERMARLGLIVSRDAVGNLSGLWPSGDRPAVMLGSHLDTVPMGGFFDGALGVCAAMECIRVLKDARIVPMSPVEVVATAEEEGRFGGMLGAQALAGRVDPAWLEAARDEGDIRLVDAMRAQGLAPEAVATAARARPRSKPSWSFISSRVRCSKPRGCRSASSRQSPVSSNGRCGSRALPTTPARRRCTCAGTPLPALPNSPAGIPQLIAEVGTEQSRVTIGAVTLVPNFPHTVPGEAVFSLIGRDTSLAVMRALAGAGRRRLEAVAAKAGLGLDIEEQSWLDPKPCHPDIVAAFRRQAERLGLGYRLMSSGAGHDTQFMAELTRAGLIFVPSIGGVSHAPDEDTAWVDIEAGANLLLHTLLDLAVGGA